MRYEKRLHDRGLTWRRCAMGGFFSSIGAAIVTLSLWPLVLLLGVVYMGQKAERMMRDSSYDCGRCTRCVDAP